MLFGKNRDQIIWRIQNASAVALTRIREATNIAILRDDASEVMFFPFFEKHTCNFVERFPKRETSPLTSEPAL